MLHLGHDFDTNTYPPIPSGATATDIRLGIKGLLLHLEQYYGLSGYPEHTEYLRIELYRQALAQWLETELHSFYAASYTTDRFATATTLLQYRDDLLLAGWDFSLVSLPNMPSRLVSLAQVEHIFKKKLLSPEHQARAQGEADRFAQVTARVRLYPPNFQAAMLYEPRYLLPVHLLRLLVLLEAQGVAISIHPLANITHPLAREGTDLHRFQQRVIRNISPEVTASSAPSSAIPCLDGSLLLLHARSETSAAAWLSKILAKQPNDPETAILATQQSVLLTRCMHLEGMPAAAEVSTSLARPSLQVLKLAPVFLWEPLDIYKIMEFVTLTVKPLPTELASIIAKVLAEKPGIKSDTWYARVLGYLDDKEEADKESYRFWFERRRHRVDGTAPRREVISIYSYLYDWATKSFEDGGRNSGYMLALAEQARRIRELLHNLPDARLSYLDVERIVRTVYEPSAAELSAAQVGSLPIVRKTGAWSAPVAALWWWHCTDESVPPGADIWLPEERAWLVLHHVLPDAPDKKARLRQYLQTKPLLCTQEKLVMVVPHNSYAMEALPHPLVADMLQAFTDGKLLMYDLESLQDRKRLSKTMQLPDIESLTLSAPVPLPVGIEVEVPEGSIHNEYETVTGLQTFFEYPHQWFLSNKAKLYKASLLSIKTDETFYGNLAHRFMELLLLEDFYKWSRNEVFQWIDTKSVQLLEEEGALLLLYGKEPERERFKNTVKQAAWSLIRMIVNNHWRVEATEKDLTGTFADLHIRAKADLILARDAERAIVDLKWGGTTYRKDLINNMGDLQLTLYAHLLPPEQYVPYSAYFIIRDAGMIARNRKAFVEAVIPPSGAIDDHEAVHHIIVERMRNTLAWRQEQLLNKFLELRTSATVPQLEALYEGLLMDMVNLPTESSKYDQYKALLWF